MKTIEIMDEKNKNNRKPHRSDKVKFYQGYYLPKNQEKCLTKKNVYRSFWEFQFMRWCDDNPMVLHWASEPFGIPYLNPVENLEYCVKQHLDPNNPANWKKCTYYTDFWIEIVDNSQPEGYKRIFIELKPYAQTQCPKPVNESAPLKEYKRYNKEAMTYAVNKCKWDAASEYFHSRGNDFMVITEKTLEKLGLNLSAKDINK